MSNSAPEKRVYGQSPSSEAKAGYSVETSSTSSTQLHVFKISEDERVGIRIGLTKFTYWLIGLLLAAGAINTIWLALINPFHFRQGTLTGMLIGLFSALPVILSQNLIRRVLFGKIVRRISDRIIAETGETETFRKPLEKVLIATPWNPSPIQSPQLKSIMLPSTVGKPWLMDIDDRFQEITLHR